MNPIRSLMYDQLDSLYRAAKSSGLFAEDFRQIEQSLFAVKGVAPYGRQCLLTALDTALAQIDGFEPRLAQFCQRVPRRTKDKLARIRRVLAALQYAAGTRH